MLNVDVISLLLISDKVSYISLLSTITQSGFIGTLCVIIVVEC